MKTYLGAALLLALSSAAFAVEITPPLTSEEQGLVEEMQERWIEQGMPPLTDEQVAAFVQRMRSTRLDMMAAEAGIRTRVPSGNQDLSGVFTGQVPTAEVQPREPLAQVSPDVLAAELALRQGEGRFTRFERSGDGFLYDGAPHIDADGIITSFGADSATGAVTYLVDAGGGLGLVKHHNVHSTAAPILIGQYSQHGSAVNFRSVTGDTATGQGLIPTSDGLIVFRQHSLIAYRAGEGLTPRALPREFTLTPIQGGDIAATGYVLVERSEAPDLDNPVERLRDLGHTVRAVFGREVRSDFALVNIATGHAVTLNIPLDGKNVTSGVNCRARGQFVNECQDYETRESIWQKNGLRNTNHYFWAVNWFSTRFGPVAIVLEDGMKTLNAINLETGVRTPIFTRRLGIAQFDVHPTGDGSLSVSARVGLTRKEVDLAQIL